MTTVLGDTYARNSEFWVRIIRERLDRYRNELTDEAVLAAVGAVRGQRVLDAGCGEGYLSRYLAERGANVVGVDSSDSLIRSAIEEKDRRGLAANHYVGDLSAVPESDAAFDAVVCNHVISDVQEPTVVLEEFGRVLRPGGRLVLLMLHPCFYTAHAERDATGSISVDRYFSVRGVDQSFKVAGIESPDEVHMTFRPLEDYTVALSDAGFLIERITEPHPTPDMLRDQWWRQNWVKPLFMLISARKL